MMFHFPYSGMPYYGKDSRYGYRYPYYNSSCCSSNHSHEHNTVKNVKNVDNIKKEESRSNFNEDSPMFQLFGVNLYFDDILLVCLIWFLYDDGVKDEGLFIVLILLLLS